MGLFVLRPGVQRSSFPFQTFPPVFSTKAPSCDCQVIRLSNLSLLLLVPVPFHLPPPPNHCQLPLFSEDFSSGASEAMLEFVRKYIKSLFSSSMLVISRSTDINTASQQKTEAKVVTLSYVPPRMMQSGGLGRVSSGTPFLYFSLGCFFNRKRMLPPHLLCASWSFLPRGRLLAMIFPCPASSLPLGLFINCIFSVSFS